MKSIYKSFSETPNVLYLVLRIHIARNNMFQYITIGIRPLLFSLNIKRQQQKQIHFGFPIFMLPWKNEYKW